MAQGAFSFAEFARALSLAVPPSIPLNPQEPELLSSSPEVSAPLTTPTFTVPSLSRSVPVLSGALYPVGISLSLRR
jgi:hypothetical protein